MVLKVFHQNKGFLIKLSCAIEKKNTNKKNVPFFTLHENSFFFSASQFEALDLNIFGHNSQNMEIVGC